MEFLPGASKVTGFNLTEKDDEVSNIRDKKKTNPNDLLEGKLAGLSSRYADVSSSVENVCRIADQAEKYVCEQVTVLDCRVLKKMVKVANRALMEEISDYFGVGRYRTHEQRVMDMFGYQQFLCNEEDGGPLRMYRPPDDGWRVMVDGEFVRLQRDHDKRPLFVGEPLELVSFLVQHYPSLARKVRRVLMTLVVEEEYSNVERAWSAELAAHREFRYRNKALEKYSKVSQMKNANADSDVSMFGLNGEEPVDFIIGDQLERMAYLCPEAVWRQRVVGDEQGFICAATIKGDVVGASANDYQLLSDLWELSSDEDFEVRVKIYMDEKIPENYKGYLLNKGRPHNMVCVVVLSRKGKVLRTLFTEMFQGIREANKERDVRYLDFREPDLLSGGYNIYHFQHVLRKGVYRSSGLKTKLEPKLSGYSQLVKSVSVERRKNFLEMCFDPGYIVHKRRFRLGRYFDIEGPLSLYDLAVGPVDFTFNSVYLWAKESVNHVLEYTASQGWIVKRKNKPRLLV